MRDFVVRQVCYGEPSTREAGLQLGLVIKLCENFETIRCLYVAEVANAADADVDRFIGPVFGRQICCYDRVVLWAVEFVVENHLLGFWVVKL